jgi:SAM-dependent methyltransferase
VQHEDPAARAALRRTTFRFQDSVMLASTLRALDCLGLLAAGVVPDVAGWGYLRVGLRCLAAEGWLEDAPGLEPTELRWTESGRAVLEQRELLVAAGEWLAGFTGTGADAWRTPWSDAALGRLDALLDARDPGDELLDGALALPVVLALRGAGQLGQDGPTAPAEPMARTLTAIGWVDADGRWTGAGRMAQDFVDHLGLVGSYLPMLSALPELYRGERLVRPGPGEWHCNRDLNIEASGAAHRRYFADADVVFDDIFARSRPQFVADMGCGDGSWLVHLHGRYGDRVRYVGVDVSDAAVEHARAVLEAHGVADAVVIRGDVSRPDDLAEKLAAHGLDISSGVHIRSFLDHDRTYRGGDPDLEVPGWASGAYVAPDGRPLTAQEVEQDLVAHLRRWAPYVRRHGLTVLEAHCVAPAVTRRHLGALHSLTFDAYHGLSHQYPVEHASFMRCCRLAGMQPASHVDKRYPSSRPFVAVSMNHLTPIQPGPPPGSGVRSDTWRPEPGTDLEDGRGLHHLMFTEGDLGHPRTWCSGATGIVVAGALEAVEARLETAGPGDVVRVLDYGAGTGLAAIELIKACINHEIPERLAARGATIELHLVDIPGSWFAMGHRILEPIDWTHFHALRDDEGRFRPLAEVTGGLAMDAVMANMVFHLLTPQAMERAAAELAGILTPGGRISYSSPDLGPASEYSLLFHAPNRRLRERWLAALDSNDPDGLPPAVRAAVESVPAEARADAQARADRRILPQPQTAQSVGEAFAARLSGGYEQRSYELLAEESLLTILVPSNQEEFLPEIEDRPLREAAIRHLMTEEVLPELMSGPAGTALGLNVQWTLGSYERPS